ncbi:MAG: helix-turn-helix domain-containing protein [Acidobacteriota bacterium]
MKQLLSPRELASALGVSQSSIKRWTDEGKIHASRTAGGHRRIPVAEVIRFVRETDVCLLEPQILGLNSVETRIGEPGDLGEAAERLERFLVAGAAEESKGLVLSLFLDGHPLAAIGDSTLRPAFKKIGHAWLEGPEGVFLEHRATEICMQILYELTELITVPDQAPVCLGGSPAGEQAHLGSLLVAATLRDQGYRTVNLGADTPASALRHAIEDERPRLVWLSVTHARDPQGTRAEIEGLCHWLEPFGCALVVGGRAVRRLELQPRGRLLIVHSLAELVAFVQGLRLDAGGRTGGSEQLQHPSNGHAGGVEAPIEDTASASARLRDVTEPGGVTPEGRAINGRAGLDGRAPRFEDLHRR